MRILILNQYFEPDVAASAQRLTELAEDLAAHHDVAVIAGRPSYDPIAVEGTPRTRPPRLKVRRVLSTTFHRHREIGRIVNYLTFLGGALALGLYGPKPHLVIAATDPPLVGVVGRWISLLRGAPFVHLLWDIQPQVAIAAGVLREGGMASAIDTLNRTALRGASAVIVPTENMKQSAIACCAPADRISVVPLWEDTAAITPQPRDNPFSRQHGLVDRFVVMYSGNLGLTQSLEVILDVATRLRDLEDAVVVLIGEGAARRSLQAQAERRLLSNVRFLPYHPRSTMAFSLAAADVFLVPLKAGLTRYMLPSKIFSIMASGRPVVAAIDQASDTAQLVERERFGFVAPPGDAAAIEGHLRWLHAHPDERRTMGLNARLAAEQRYARTVITPKYVELLRQFEPARDHPSAAPVERPSHSRP